MAARRRLSAAGVGVAVLALSTAVEAEVSTWALLGGGALGSVDESDAALHLSGTMSIDMGLGSDASGVLIGGGLLRIEPVLDRGAELALLARLATTGFQRGPIGFAFDAGGYQRTWGPLSTGFVGEVVIGGPLGLQLALSGSVGTGAARGFGASVGLDLARLTVHRGHFESWWPNPRPGEALDHQALLGW